MSTIRRKHPSMIRSYPFDFSLMDEIRWDGETLTGTPTVVVVTGDLALNLGTPVISGSKVTITIGSGTDGVTYLLRCTVQTSGGATLTMSGKLAVTNEADLA